MFRRPRRTLLAAARLGAVLLSLFASACAERPLRKDPVISLEGRVSLSGSGIGGAEVTLYRLDELLGARPEAAAKGVTASDGLFRLEAPAGSYVLVARRGDRFSFYGRNPVRLNSPQQGLNLPLVEAHPAATRRTVSGQETTTGRVLRNGKPVVGARVTAYLDLAMGLRGPGYASSDPTGPDGAYSLALQPGTYLLAARLRSSGSDTGPLSPGDLFGVSSEFPVTLREAEVIDIDLELTELPGRDRMARLQGRFATLEGTAVDGQGRPVSGIRACLFDNSRLLNQPLVVSEPTGPDGRFSLETPLAGPFFLGARERLGAPPVPGEKVGFFVGAPEGRVVLTPGARLKDLKIAVQVVR